MRLHSIRYSKFTFKVLTFALTFMTDLQIPRFGKKIKAQLNDELDENTMLLTMYNLIGLCEHENDHHHYKQFVSIHSTTNVVSKTYTKQKYD